MDVALAAVAESLAYEFGDLCSRDVVEVVSDCVDQDMYDDPWFVEEAARARLSLLRGGSPSTSGRKDTLDVSLHDDELAEEVELTVRLIVAANESDRPLTEHEVDEILDVRRTSR